VVPAMEQDKNKEIEIKTFSQLIEEFEKVLLIPDKGIIKTIAAAILSNQMSGFPVWLFLVGSSSGGKSEFIQAFNDITLNGRPLMFPISDLTVNAMASGQKKIGKETSLLHQMPPGGMLMFKDFTSMVSKAKEAKAEIFKQLREIYDGSYTKRTGTGDNVEWDGKVGAIAGATEVIYEYQEEFSAMGDRFVMYSLIQPSREALVDFVMDESRINNDKIAERARLRIAVKSYMEFLIDNFKEEEIHLDPAVKENLKKVADFCTRVRSGVIVDERKSHIVKFVPSIEMPIRMLHQLISMAKAMIAMRKIEPLADVKDGQLTLEEEQILYKIAFDSIPIKRRMALKALAKYEGGVSTKGLAISINYQTPVVGAWLAQLNSLGVCTRQAKGGPKGDMWNLRDEFRKVMVRFENIDVTNEALVSDEDDEYPEQASLNPTVMDEKEREFQEC